MRLPVALLASLLAPALLAAQPADPEHRIHALPSGAPTTFDALADALAGADVVFLGEMHDDTAGHRVKAALLDALGARRPRLLLSLEMFERDVQVAVDEYAAGRMEAEPFLAAARPWPNHAGAYQPLVERARAGGWPVVAANIPRPLASAVARGGVAALDTLPAAQARWHAARWECAPEGTYFQRFAEAMGDMGGHGGAGAVERFYASQCLKDETMAESIARAREAWPGWGTVHVNGAFHSDFRLGTVERLARRVPGVRIAVVSIIPVDDPGAADPAEHAERADFVIFTRRARAEP